MMHKIIIILIFSFSPIILYSQSIQNCSIEAELEELSTDSLRKIYLENIYLTDQDCRDIRQNMIDKYGFNSMESYKSSLEMMYTDALNFKRIISFIEAFGYPTVQKYGEKASGSVWLVVHHNYGMPYKYLGYKILKNAWETKELSDEKFEFYLQALLRNQIQNETNLKISDLVVIADKLTAPDK